MGIRPNYPGVYVNKSDDSVHIVLGVNTSITAFIGIAKMGPANKAIFISSFGEYESIFGGIWEKSSMSYSVYLYFLNGGNRAVIIRIDDNLPVYKLPTFKEIIGDPKNNSGIYALNTIEQFNLLCIPPLEINGSTDIVIYKEALKYCKSRRAILIVDPPIDWNSANDTLNHIEELNIRDKNAVMFFPRVTIADPQNNNFLNNLAPSGSVAGVIARIDAERGVWQAPAGIDADLKGIKDLSVHLDEKENVDLNQKGINCLRNFPNVGIVVWGARTLVGSDDLASEWKYLHVRRLTLYIEESLYRGTKWIVFEPNNELLWSKIRLNVDGFMLDLFRKGAFQGTMPKEAYFVKCDNETNTQFDIENKIVNIIVGFAPLKPAEFVTIKIQQIATG